MKAIIGKKVGMSQIFDENGKVIPVTVIEADRKSTRLNSSHITRSRMPSSA